MKFPFMLAKNVYILEHLVIVPLMQPECITMFLELLGLPVGENVVILVTFAGIIGASVKLEQL